MNQPATTGKNANRGGVRILLIDDERELGRLVRGGLNAAGFTVEWATTAEEGKSAVVAWHPDVVILDLTLPDGDGLDVCQQIRSWSSVPIIVLSVRSGDEDKITAIDRGADDYVVKPFSMPELVARVRLALRHAVHTAANGGDVAQFITGSLVLDFAQRRVTLAGNEVHLTPTEYELLKYLATNAGKVITHHQLLRAVWGPSYDKETHYLHVFVGQLRRKIEPDPSRPQYLVTDSGIGYHLTAP